MNKLIIENRGNLLSTVEALPYIKRIMDMGKVSNFGKQYCYATTFKNSNIVIYAMQNKKSDRFIILDDEEPNQ